MCCWIIDYWTLLFSISVFLYTKCTLMKTSDNVRVMFLYTRRRHEQLSQHLSCRIPEIKPCQSENYLSYYENYDLNIRLPVRKSSVTCGVVVRCEKDKKMSESSVKSSKNLHNTMWKLFGFLSESENIQGKGNVSLKHQRTTGEPEHVGHLLLLDVLLDVVRAHELRRRFDRQFHLGQVVGRQSSGVGPAGRDLLRNGSLRDHGVAVGGPVNGRRWKQLRGHRLLFTRLPVGARFADAELRPEAHSSVLALGDTVRWRPEERGER